MIRLKEKRFVKLLMSKGYSRNRANYVAGLIPVATVELLGKVEQLTYARSWDAVRAHFRVKELAQKEATGSEA